MTPHFVTLLLPSHLALPDKLAAGRPAISRRIALPVVSETQNRTRGVLSVPRVAHCVEVCDPCQSRVLVYLPTIVYHDSGYVTRSP